MYEINTIFFIDGIVNFHLESLGELASPTNLIPLGMTILPGWLEADWPPGCKKFVVF